MHAAEPASAAATDQRIDAPGGGGAGNVTTGPFATTPGASAEGAFSPAGPSACAYDHSAARSSSAIVLIAQYGIG